jgi:hypothetical protein
MVVLFTRVSLATAPIVISMLFTMVEFVQEKILLL